MCLLNCHHELVNEVRIILRKKRQKERRSFELHPIYSTKCPVLWNTDVSCQGNPALTHVGNAVPSGGVTCGNLKDESWPMTTILKVCTLPGKKGRSQYHHTFTYIMVLTLPQQAQRQTPKKFVEAPGLKIMTTTTALPLPVPRLKQCTLSGYSSEMPSNSYINSQSKFAPKKNSELKLLVEGAELLVPHLEATLAEKLLALPPKQLNNGPGTRYWSQWIL